MYNTKLKEFKNSQRYRSLVARGASCFISVRNSDGELSQRILQELPVEDFFQEITKVDDDVEGITGEDLMHFTVTVESMLKHFTDNIVELINNANNQLFNKFIEYDQGGIFRTFAAKYNRIILGRISNIEPLMMGIHRLYAHYFKEFKKTPDFRRNKHLISFYDSENNRYVYPIDLIAENFAMLINVLCMNMMCEYYTDKENFTIETDFQDSINAIREHLNTLFDSPTHTVEINSGRNYYNQPLVDLYIVNLAFNNPAKLDDLELIIGQQISRKTLIQFMKPNMRETYINSDLYNFEIKLDHQSADYFDTLTDLLSKINHIEAMYLKLKQLSQINSPDDEKTASTLFHLYLKKPVKSTELAVKQA